MTFWRHVFTKWDEVVSPDLHQVFGVDTESRKFNARPWWWARARIYALLDTDTRLARSVRDLPTS